MIEEIDAFGRDAMPGYDDLVKARLSLLFEEYNRCFGNAINLGCVKTQDPALSVGIPADI